MRDNSFPHTLVEGYGRNNTKVDIKIYSSGQGMNPQIGGINPLKKRTTIVQEQSPLKKLIH
jgi:hypothetical protein